MLDGLKIKERTVFFWVIIFKLIFLINNYNFVIRVIRFYLDGLVGLFIGLSSVKRVFIIEKRLLFLLLLFILLIIFG